MVNATSTTSAASDGMISKLLQNWWLLRPIGQSKGHDWTRARTLSGHEFYVCRVCFLATENHKIEISCAEALRTRNSVPDHLWEATTNAEGKRAWKCKFCNQIWVIGNCSYLDKIDSIVAVLEGGKMPQNFWSSPIARRCSELIVHSVMME
jgi:hypothetical protein